jgi:Fe-S cluster biosynthesis and repair protein YggX
LADSATYLFRELAACWASQPTQPSRLISVICVNQWLEVFFGRERHASAGFGKMKIQQGDAHMPRMVNCMKLGRELPGLDEPPFDTPLGQRIYESISAEAWRMWSEHSKMLLNEYRLQPWKPEAQQFLVEQMEAFFFGSGSSLPKEYVPPKS